MPRTGARAQSANQLTPDAQAVAHLAPVSPALLAARNEVDAARRGVAEVWERPIASNLWIAGSKKTADGSTVLINGPQFNWFNPSYVFAVGLHGAGFEVTGNTPFAHPVVLFGTNGTIAWGATAGPLDVNDMYQETLNPANRYEYLFNGSMRAMSKRIETIEVKGQPDETLDVYTTVHGIVTDFDPANNTAYSMKRSWDGYEIESLLGWTHMMQAQNWEQWLAQAARVAISINWYYADAQGNIGYVSPGRLPIRPASQDPARQRFQAALQRAPRAQGRRATDLRLLQRRRQERRDPQHAREGHGRPRSALRQRHGALAHARGPAHLSHHQLHGRAAGRGRRAADATELHEPRRAEPPGDVQRRHRLDVHRRAARTKQLRGARWPQVAALRRPDGALQGLRLQERMAHSRPARSAPRIQQAVELLMLCTRTLCRQR